MQHRQECLCHSVLILDRSACRDFDRSSRLEWLDTNNTGGYAMGTVAGVNTRRYHGLLVASLRQPLQRCVTLSKLDEEATIDGQRYELATNQYPGVVSPKGFEWLDSFRLDPFPCWTWQLDQCWLSKEVFLIKDKQAVVVQYSCSGPCLLTVRPFLAFRDYHSLVHANPEFNRSVEMHPAHFKIRPYPGYAAIGFHHNARSFDTTGLWYYNFEYLVELDRGMDFREDLYTPGSFEFELQPNQPAFIVASLDDEDRYDTAVIDEIKRTLRRNPPVANSPFEVKLTSASNQFRACREDGRPTVMAGFPWFADWGRDTMISLPGLFITRGMLNDARDIIESFLIHLNQGLIPNHYPDFGTPEYNTCDATLWMFQAVWSYMQGGGDLPWIKGVFYPAAKEIVGWHERGTLYEIKVDPEDGLLSAGVEGTQLTWMDAKVGDWVVTPRHGKPVEINALWYNALRIAAHWAVEFSETDYAHKLAGMADRVHANFAQKFWNPERNCLYDVLGFDGPIAKLRPNQLFAVSLPFDLLNNAQQRSVVEIVERELLTPAGLRTLERSDPEYRGRYEGDRVSRDGAYHQGTVWPWLLGPFVTAYLKANGKSKTTLEHCRLIVNGMEPEMLIGGLGSIAEIYDGDPPHLPRGCIAQAWSVAELLRVLRSDLS
ncbi:MAG: amylo-alpha-1,6-glucosidase [Bryobacteraceae bacterium]